MFCRSKTLPPFYGDFFWRNELLYVLFQDGKDERAILRLARFCKCTQIWEPVKVLALNMINSFGGHFYPQKSAYLPWLDVLLLFTQRSVFAINCSGFDNNSSIKLIPSHHPLKDKLLSSASLPIKLEDILSAADQSTWAVTWSAPIVVNDFKEKAVYAVAHVYSKPDILTPNDELNYSCLFRLLVTEGQPIQINFQLLDGLDLNVKLPKYASSLGVVYDSENKVNEMNRNASQQLKLQKRTLVICYQTKNPSIEKNSSDLTSFNSIVSIFIIEKFPYSFCIQNVLTYFTFIQTYINLDDFTQCEIYHLPTETEETLKHLIKLKSVIVDEYLYLFTVTKKVVKNLNLSENEIARESRLLENRFYRLSILPTADQNWGRLCRLKGPQDVKQQQKQQQDQEPLLKKKNGLSLANYQKNVALASCAEPVAKDVFLVGPSPKDKSSELWIMFTEIVNARLSVSLRQPPLFKIGKLLLQSTLPIPPPPLFLHMYRFPLKLNLEDIAQELFFSSVRQDLGNAEEVSDDARLAVSTSESRKILEHECPCISTLM